MKVKNVILSACVFACGVSSEVRAQDLMPEDNGIFTYHTSPRWRESESHPLRIAAYIVHPIGWVLREGIFRPISYAVSSTKFTRSFFGYREPFDYKEPKCFFGTENIPDCRQLAPYNMLGRKDSSVEQAAPEVVTEEKVVFPDIAFEFDKSTLNSLGKGRVRQVAQMLSSMPTVKVIVEGHTDSRGTDEYNIKLGERRAQAVIKELTELGVDPARMSPVSFGESKPVFAQDDDWARAINRRVQFSVQGAQQESAVTQAAASMPPAKAE